MQRIVVGVDGSHGADTALAWAVREAELRDADVDVVHCYVVHARGIVMDTPDQKDALARLDEVVERNRQRLDRVTWSADIMGVANSPSAGLVDMGVGAALIVVGARGAGGFARLRLGSTGYRTAAHATAPVAVIPDADDRGSPRADHLALTVGVDGSRAATRALQWAVEEARRREAPLTAVHAYGTSVDTTRRARLSGERREQLLTRAREEAEVVVRNAFDRVDASGVDVDVVYEHGAPADALLSRSGADRLLVVGTHGRGTIGRMIFGSVSHQCLHHADGPVVVVP